MDKSITEWDKIKLEAALENLFDDINHADLANAHDEKWYKRKLEALGRIQYKLMLPITK